jgi:hypothetical protein
MPILILILLTLGTQPECDGFGICEIEKMTEAKLEECSKFENCVLASLDYSESEFTLSVS